MSLDFECDATDRANVEPAAVQIRREVDSTHGFKPAHPAATYVGAELPSTHVRPSSINSSEVRLRHQHEVAANDGHEIQHGEESRLSGRTIGGAAEGPSTEPPSNTREAGPGAFKGHGILHEKVNEKQPSDMV